MINLIDVLYLFKFFLVKNLIENATKLYGEFWGSLATNLTNNLNLTKLFNIGNKLNGTLREINVLWDTDIKYLAISLENQNIIHLYAYFVREILKNAKKAEEIQKKINEENFFDDKKVKDDRFTADNMDKFLENEEALIISRVNEVIKLL